ncbi:MBL fold metallo-hydrolase [Sneathiella litorea]|uniref:MBL fold metallo-hydrolase n=1 Tax=Sneathiella litorea TaxID=2606216 RepID=A0A6L8WBA0_9PROT|nr:MBL fold metallo-hydrolase [Sneathiella litorea]MZR31939.1 MBL fold metallo-hydrolase [Sneathiella litorea]
MTYNEITYPFDTRPGDGEVLEVSEGILWVRMPIPIPGLDYINLYLIEDEDGWTMVDSGLNTGEIRDHWRNIYEKYLKGKPITRMLCTHFHPDHMGQAGWVTYKWKIPLTMTFGEWTFGRMLYLEAQEETPDYVIDFYRSVGFSEAMLEKVRDRGFNNFRQAMSQVPMGFNRIEDGDSITIGKRDWQVIVGTGHSPEHACLYSASDGILISGDQVLPRITPHIGVYPAEPFANPLKKFMDSIEIFKQLPRDTLVLPAHNDVFYGLHNQLDFYQSHHEDRLNRLILACDTPQSAMDLLPVLFDRELNEKDKGLGIAEGLAHCHYLVVKGKLERVIGEDGIWKFQKSGARYKAVA